MYYRYIYVQSFFNKSPVEYLNDDGSLKNGISLVDAQYVNAGLPHNSAEFGASSIPVLQNIMYNGEKIGERRIVGEILGISLAKTLKITLNGVEYHRSAVFGITR